MAAAAFTVMTHSVVAVAATPAFRALTGLGTAPAAGARVLGFTAFQAAAADRVTVAVLGSAIAEAGAAVAVDALLEVDVQGRVITKTSGIAVGRALQAASGAGQMVEVFLFPN
ncbi:MAG: DUF2190 family protein [Pseudomonadota bacterium]|nr:DUF2190 family protein [Pseudomonadota bacterium]